MAKRDNKGIIRNLLEGADIRIGGNKPWDIQVHNPNLYNRLLAGGSLAAGESYMDGWWDCEALDQFFYKIFSAQLEYKIKRQKNVMWASLIAKLTNPQKKSNAFEIGERHYDRGNNLYKHMLDKRMVYSCGYWDKAENLDRAQEAKLDLICRKAGLEPGQKVLDIGCGWGSFIKYAAEKYDVKATGVTVSEEQVKLGRKMCKGLPVDIRLQDYRDVDEEFDHIISVGMIEHVGYKNYRTFMEVVCRCLKPCGRLLLQTIGSNISHKSNEPWVSKYIFPNSLLPSAKQITTAAEGLLTLRDWHSFGTHYDKTLMAWHRNFIANWEHIKDDYDKRFYRMWCYYLLSFAGSFRANKFQLWQIVFTHLGAEGEYRCIR